MFYVMFSKKESTKRLLTHSLFLVLENVIKKSKYTYYLAELHRKLGESDTALKLFLN